MIFGHSYWILIWFGILALGVIGLVPALQWGRQTHWKNKDEIARGIGTILVSSGMLLLLWGLLTVLASALLALAVVAFVFAFVAGRKADKARQKPPMKMIE
jgi:protein-S-isoprenylcysteine O-methyltransferase Ste14